MKSRMAADKVAQLQLFSYTVDRHGNVTYSDLGGPLLRDEAKIIGVLRRDEQAIEVSLRLAQAKFYDPKTRESLLVASGSDEFKQRLVEVAAQNRMAVRFDDPAMETRRRALIAAIDKEAGARKGQGRPLAGEGKAKKDDKSAAARKQFQKQKPRDQERD